MSAYTMTEIRWVLSDERTGTVRTAVAFTHDGNTVACFAFAETGEGLVDLVGVQASPASEFRSAKDVAVGFAKVIANSPRRSAGMRTSDVRVLTHSALLSRVHRELRSDDGAIAPRSWFGAGIPVVNDRQTRGDSRLRLARFVVAYAAVARTASGSVQEAMADQEGVSVYAIRERLRRAREAGLYATTGSGRQGQPTPEAYRIIDEAQPVAC